MPLAAEVPNLTPPDELGADKGASLWLDAWHRLARNKLAVASAVFLFLLNLQVAENTTHA